MQEGVNIFEVFIIYTQYFAKTLQKSGLLLEMPHVPLHHILINRNVQIFFLF